MDLHVSLSQTNFPISSVDQSSHNPPTKRLSIFLPTPIKKRNSILPLDNSTDMPTLRIPRKNKRNLTVLPKNPSSQYVLKTSKSIIDLKPSPIEKCNSPYMPSNNTMLFSNRMCDSRARLYIGGDYDEKSDYLEQDIDLNCKDSEERHMLYQQIQEIIIKDDNEDFYKVGLLMEDDNEEELWIDPAQEFQSEADRFIKLQEDQQFLYCERKNAFELIKAYADPYPFLRIRKTLAFISRKISVICKLIIKHPIFDYFVLFIILWNCVLLAIEDPTTNPTSAEAQMEQILLICYSIEMSLKIIGLGFICHKKAYLRDGWNVLDFIIIITSYLPYMLTNESDTSSFKLSSLRILRVLRPLRTISSIKSLRNLLVTLFSSMPLLLDILLFLLFFFVTFAMIGVHLFSGVLKNRCFFKETGLFESVDEVCGYKACSEESFCGKGLDNPNYGVTNFDNILFSFIMGFQCVTLQAWTVVMVEVIKGYSIYAIIYFVTLVFFGSLFLLNLTLAVIKSKFTDTQKLKESLGKAAIKKLSEVQIDELKLFKRMERSHYKRMRNQIQKDRIGASEDDRPGNSRFNEITWEDLLQLKEMIREDRLREEEEENFILMRQENVKSDDILEEKKFMFYIRKVQNLKKNAMRLFLKKGIPGFQRLPPVFKTSKVYPSSAISDKKESLEEIKNSIKVFPVNSDVYNESIEKKEKNEALYKTNITLKVNNIEHPEIYSNYRKSAINQMNNNNRNEGIYRKSAAVYPEPLDKNENIIYIDKANKTNNLKITVNEIKSPLNKPNTTNSLSPNNHKSNNAKLDRKSTLDKSNKLKAIQGTLTPKHSNIERKHSQEQTSIETDHYSQKNEYDIEDPAIFISDDMNIKKLTNNALAYKDLKIKAKQKANVMFFNRRQSIKHLPSLTRVPSITISDNYIFTGGMEVNPITEEAENEDQDNIYINENQEQGEDKVDIEEKSSFETDLLNDSDFNDSVTLNKAKLEAILQSKSQKEESEVKENEAQQEEIEGLETKISDRPLLREAENNNERNETNLTRNLSKLEEKDKNTSQPGPLKRNATLKKHVKNHNVKFQSQKTKSFEERKPKIVEQKRANIRDFNLMVDMEKQYIGYSIDDVLENRIIELAERKKMEELKAINEQNYKIDLKPTNLKDINKEVLDQIKDNRRKMLSLQNISKKNKISLPLKKAWLFQRIATRPPTLTFRRPYIPQGSFMKNSPRSPRKQGNKKKKGVLLKLDDELEMTYTSIQQKINESMIPKKSTIDIPTDADIEKEYLEIHREDRAKKKKCNKVFSGSEVLPLRLFQGYWSLTHINGLFSDLSFSKQDKLIWLPTIQGQVI